MQMMSKLFVTVLFLSLTSHSWSQTEAIDKLASGKYLAAYPPGPYNWYPPPAPWGPPPGWMQPPRASYGMPAYAMHPAPPQPTIVAITSERDKLKADLDTQQNELSDTRDQLLQAQASLEDARSNINSAQTEALNNQNDQVALNDKLAAATAESILSKSQLNQLDEQIEILNKAVKQQKSDLESFQQRAEEQQTEIEQLLVKISEGDDKVASLQAELTAVTASFDAAKLESTAANENLSALETQQQSCSQELTELTSKLEQESTLSQDKHQEMDAATAKHDALSNQLSMCSEALASEKAELKIAHSEVDKLLVRLLPEKTQEAAKSNYGSAEKLAVEKKSKAVVAGGGERIKSATVPDMQSTEIDAIEDQQATETESADAHEIVTHNEIKQVEPALVAIKPIESDKELVKMPANVANLDFDRDGVNDAVDLCLDSNLVSEVGVLGCSAGQPIIMDGVVFSYDSHELTREARGVLDNIVSILMHHPDLKLEVAGHSDVQGNADYNRWLSGLRAGAVRDYLIGKGLRIENLTAHGYGPDHPVATNDTREGLHMNRRVELRRLE
jgi:OOP family OmpA-OmpF porin